MTVMLWKKTFFPSLSIQLLFKSSQFYLYTPKSHITNWPQGASGKSGIIPYVSKNSPSQSLSDLHAWE